MTTKISRRQALALGSGAAGMVIATAEAHTDMKKLSPENGGRSMPGLEDRIEIVPGI